MILKYHVDYGSVPASVLVSVSCQGTLVSEFMITDITFMSFILMHLNHSDIYLVISISPFNKLAVSFDPN